MRRFALIALMAPLAPMTPAAMADAPAWKGVFSTATVPGCRIEGPAQSVSVAQAGQGAYGPAPAAGVLGAIAAQAERGIWASLGAQARAAGYNGVIGAQIQISHAPAPMGGGAAGASYVVAAHGTAVHLRCDWPDADADAGVGAAGR